MRRWDLPGLLVCSAERRGILQHGLASKMTLLQLFGNPALKRLDAGLRFDAELRFNADGATVVVDSVILNSEIVFNAAEHPVHQNSLLLGGTSLFAGRCWALACDVILTLICLVSAYRFGVCFKRYFNACIGGLTEFYRIYSQEHAMHIT